MVDTYGAHESRVYFVVESVYGETPTNPLMLGINTEGVEPGLDSGLISVRGIGSRDLQALKKGLRKLALKFSHIPSSDAPIGFIQHVQTLNSLSIQTLYYKGIFASATDIISLLYKGCRIDKLSVECSIEDIIKATVDVIGQDVAVGTAKIAGASYGDYAGAVVFNESYVKKGAAVLDRVSDWKFEIANNLKAVPVIRSTSGHLLKYLPARHRNLLGEVTFEFESKEEFDEVIGDTEFSLEFGLGGTNKAVFSNCKWEDLKTPTKVEDLVSLKASFVARQVAIS